MSGRSGSKRCIGVCQGALDHCCGFKTKSITGIRLHLKVTHKKKPVIKNQRENREKCTVCKETFKSIEEVIRHVKRAHRDR